MLMLVMHGLLGTILTEQGANACVRQLNKGDCFSFPGSLEMYTYTGRGWFSDKNGRRFKTGMGAYVKRLGKDKESASV